MKYARSKAQLWEDLKANSGNWLDLRGTHKAPRSPDFKHKDTNEALWIDTAPPDVLAMLPPIQYAA